ncbi:MAG TPA: CarD family transcriptional regulator, partial [Spirochaetia bacterium]|nr:CarD family transcriptional regulator [Spirochaetia bacterium]
MITLFQNNIIERLRKSAPYNEIFRRIARGDFPLEIEGPHGLFLAILTSQLQGALKESTLIITPNDQEAETLYRDLSLFHGQVSLFPGWGTVPYSGISPQAHVYGRRMTNLMRLLRGERLIVVTSLRAFLGPVPPREFLESMTVTIQAGKEFDPIELEERLVSFGYLRVPKVSVSGEFALRGEVLDVFPPDSEEAVRIVFGFDLVEEIRRFDPISQSSTEALDEITLIPMREVLWSDERIDALESYLEKRSAGSSEAVVEELRENRSCKNEEVYFPITFKQLGNLSDYLSPGSTLILLDNERLATGGEVVKKEYTELYTSFSSRRNGDELHAPLPRPSELLADYEKLVSDHERRILFPAIKDAHETHRVSLQCVGARSFFGNVAFLKEELSNLIATGYKITIFSESESQGLRIQHLLKDFQVEIIPESVSAGFSLPEQKIMVIQENEIFGRRRRIPASVKKARSAAIDTFVELAPGDFVVHVNYGIGKFKGIERIHAAGTERDYIQLEYSGEETIFIPIEQVNLIQRYIGQEGREPRLDRIGGRSWESRKERVRQSVEDLAHRLVELYAKRKTTQGFAFGADTEWQLEFEAAFPYEETVD